MKARPFPVTVLAILAGIAAVFSAVHFLQALGILPFFLGPVNIDTKFNFWNALMWALMVWVYVWVFQMLWAVDPRGWMFLAFVAVWELTFAFFEMLSATTTFSDVSITFLVNGIILLYVMLPGTREAFGVQKA